MSASSDPAHTAFESAIQEFRSNLDDERLYEKILKTKTVEEVYDATEELQREQAKNGHLRHLSKIAPFLNGLNEYAATIEVFVQAKPDILALIWGPIKLLLQWSSVLKTSFDAIINTTAEIGSLLPEFQKAAQIFGDNKQINDVLALFFKDILDFYGIILRFFKLRRWKYMFESLWPKHQEKIKVAKVNMESHTRLMRREVRLEHIQREHEARVRQLEHFEATERARRIEEYERLKTDVSPTFFDDTLYRLNGSICEGTGKWLLADENFGKWLDVTDRSAGLLWLQGIPGAGKTFLSSTVIEKTQGRGRTAFVFLSYTMANVTALSILHSITFQLVGNDESLQTVLCDSSSSNLKRHLKSTVDLVTKILHCAGPSYIVIDGLDEIEEVERGRLLEQLLVLSTDCDEAKVLISSRPESDISKALSKSATPLRVDQRNAGSIQAFVRQWTQRWFRDREFMPQEQTEISGRLAPLASNCKGMFLYAKVVLTTIEFLDDINEIRSEITTLPESLDEAYGRILQRINNAKQPALREKGRKILGWIACTPTPLTKQEILQALVIKPNDIEGHAHFAGILSLRGICGPIIEVVDGYVQFVHFTAKEYVSSPRIPGHIDTAEATLSLGMRCITYLCQSHHDPHLTGEEVHAGLLKGEYILHDYAASTWLELVELYVVWCHSMSLPQDMVDLLDTLQEARDNQYYQTQATSSIGRTNLQRIQNTFPGVYSFLCKVADFRHACSTSEHRVIPGAPWVNLDPTTISSTSLLIYQEIDKLLLHSPGDEPQNHRTVMQKWYGTRPFKCGFIQCAFHRNGFQSSSQRKSHEKHHNRPWKCSVTTCEYAEGGFLSRNMRDTHMSRHHQPDAKKDHDFLAADGDEIQFLLFDLVKLDNVEAVRTLLPRFRTWPRSVEDNTRRIAGYSGSLAMVQLLMSKKTFTEDKIIGFDWWWPLTESALKGINLEVFKFALERRGDADFAHGMFSNVVVSDSQEIYDIYQNFTATISKHPRPKVSNYLDVAQKKNIKATGGLRHREKLLLHLWKSLPGFQLSNSRQLGNALTLVAMTTCSVRLAEYLLGEGVDVDYRTGSRRCTPLHHAAKGDSAEAADFMKFLLLRGANPQKSPRFSNIEDEVGAKGISKWLHVTWDELVAQTQQQRSQMLEVEREEAQGQLSPNIQEMV